MMIAELKFTLEKWRKGEFDVGRSDIEWGYCCILSEYLLLATVVAILQEAEMYLTIFKNVKK